MPIKGAKYRFKRTKSGKMQRLAFVRGRVVEVQNYSGKKGHLKKRGSAEKV